MRSRLVIAAMAAAIILGGCPGDMSGMRPLSEGAGNVPFTGDPVDYPLEAAGYKRVGVTEYSPGKTDMSVAYNYEHGEIRIVSTVYIYRKPPGLDLATHYEQYKAMVPQAHPEATFVSERMRTLHKGSKEYRAREAVFTIEDVFGNTYQPLYSLLIMWEHDSQFGKLRTTAPIANAAIAEQKSLELLEAVNWLHYPAK